MTGHRRLIDGRLKTRAGYLEVSKDGCFKTAG